MKLLPLLIGLFFLNVAISQKIPKPKLEKHFYYVDSANRIIVELEKEIVRGVSTDIFKRTHYILYSMFSETEIGEKQNQYFTILYPTNFNTADLFRLRKLRVKGADWPSRIGEIKNNGKIVTDNIIECVVKKISKKQWLIVPTTHLKPGQYCFELNGDKFTFGILYPEVEIKDAANF